MIIGVDFDNTIVCYDDAFFKAASERGLVMESLPRTKEAVRDYLRGIGKEDDWTELQGYVYGTRMETATVFPGAVACLRGMFERGISVKIISHKTLHPYRGPAYNLHAAARTWLSDSNFLYECGLTMDSVFFELTREEKLRRIIAASCTHFIDDLPELLESELFPSNVEKLLFAPSHVAGHSGIISFDSWKGIDAYLSSFNFR